MVIRGAADCYYPTVPIIPVFGHAALRGRFLEMIARGTLPQSMLLHGPRGVGKQRLALWVGSTLLCAGESGAGPCGACQPCRYTGELTHPDLHWFFPRPRLKDSDADAADVREDYRDAIADRVKAGGLYPPAAGNEGIFVATVRAIVGAASMAPALARRKVFVIGDAERMVPQEGAEQAANALLKLLEEPPADTTLVLTSSEPGALLPTIRSRVVAYRVGPVAAADMQAMLADRGVAARLEAEGAPREPADRLRAAAGALGNLLSGPAWEDALRNARQILEAAERGDRAERVRVAFSQGAARARGGFSDTLEALTLLLHERVRAAAMRQDDSRAIGAARAIEAVERAREAARGNASPQLVGAALLREFEALPL